jgi:uncharacterized protein (TIGR02452 family)
MGAETVAICEAGTYAGLDSSFPLKSAIADAVNHSALLTPGDLAQFALQTPQAAAAATIEVTSESTLTAAARLCPDHPDALALNFASARNPGGGFLSGSQAQEESLARSSTLYPCQIRFMQSFYEVNRRQKSLLYTDNMIYSPRVPVIRNDAGQLLQTPCLLSILTAPAPNAGALNRDSDASQLIATLRRRAEYVLAAAHHFNHRTLILGAWGCGVFRNDPYEVARAFANLLLPGKLWSTAFSKITFAIFDNSSDQNVLAAFKKTLVH